MSKELFFEMRAAETAGISFEHLIDAKKSNIATAVTTIVNQVEQGNYDSLKGLILALKGKAMFTDLEKALRPLAENNYLDKLEKGYSAHDVSIEQSPTKTDYDYSVCNDREFETLSSLFDTAKDALEERKTFLKSINKPLELVDTDTGETFTVNPPNKLQKIGLKLTIK